MKFPHGEAKAEARSLVGSLTFQRCCCFRARESVAENDNLMFTYLSDGEKSLASRIKIPRLKNLLTGHTLTLVFSRVRDGKMAV